MSASHGLARRGTDIGHGRFGQDGGQHAAVEGVGNAGVAEKAGEGGGGLEQASDFVHGAGGWAAAAGAGRRQRRQRRRPCGHGRYAHVVSTGGGRLEKTGRCGLCEWARYWARGGQGKAEGEDGGVLR